MLGDGKGEFTENFYGFGVARGAVDNQSMDRCFETSREGTSYRACATTML